MNKPKMKEIFHVEYSSITGMSNEEILWYLHSIMSNIELEDGELQGKFLKLTLEEFVE